MADSKSTITSRRAQMPERDSGFHFRLTPPTVTPGQTRGRSVSSALPCISFQHWEEGTAGTFQRGKSPDHHSSGNALKLSASFRCAPHRKTHDVRQAWNDSRNLKTITRERKHRQPAILHPTNEVGRVAGTKERVAQQEASQLKLRAGGGGPSLRSGFRLRAGRPQDASTC